MGGGMPFHLEKAVLGLRLDYLTRSPAVRQHVLARLQNDLENPFVVATNISVPGMSTINALTDMKAEFTQKLNDLLQVDPNPPSSHHDRRTGAEYLQDQNTYLLPPNKDNAGNRQAFMRYWQSKMNQALIDQARQAFIIALTSLNSERTRIDHWWDCSLNDGTPPMIITSLESPGIARVLFITDHEPVEPPDTPMRGAPDPDPVQS